jgi:short-subunit dehydrogenase
MHNVLITGCSSGLGRALANKFESSGHEVMRHNGSKHYDLSNTQDIKKMCQEAKERKINVLINNAAIVCPNTLFSEYDENLIYKMISVNLSAPIILSNLLFDSLTNIININSMVGLEVKAPRTLYSATKWGLRGFSNSLKKENNNIKILDVYPTNIKTTPDRQNAMELNFVVESIYQSFIKNKEKLILDGRVM